MDLRLFVEPQQGGLYDQIMRLARAAEDAGYGAFFRSDHLMHMGGVDPGFGPTEAWVTLAGLARDTSRIRLGTLMTSATFRYPGPLAIAVAEVDAMSDGRIELGIGAGWYEAEHRAYGVPFPPVGERFDRLEEQLAVITGLWGTPAGETFSHDGEHYPIIDSPALPKPVQQPRPPIIVGGAGKRRTPALAARYADEFNAAFVPVGEAGRQFDGARAACAQAGRDPATLRLSVALTVCCGRNEKEFQARAAEIGQDPDELRRTGVAGTPAECVDTLGRFAEAGATRCYVQQLDLDNIDQAELVAAEVMPQVAAEGDPQPRREGLLRRVEEEIESFPPKL